LGDVTAFENSNSNWGVGATPKTSSSPLPTMLTDGDSLKKEFVAEFEKDVLHNAQTFEQVLGKLHRSHTRAQTKNNEVSAALNEMAMYEASDKMRHAITSTAEAVANVEQHR
jgi:hypothetical protein